MAQSNDTYHLIESLVVSFETARLGSSYGRSKDEFESSHYVIDSEVNSDGTRLAVSVSDDTIRLVDTATASAVGQFRAHSQGISSICFSASQPHLLVTSSYDSSAKIWDLRSSAEVQEFAFPVEVLAATTLFGDTMLAVSQENTVEFMDVRSSQKLGVYGDCLTDSVTRLERSPSQPSVLASAAEDGLICVYDVSAAQQQDAVVSILNTECSVSRFEIGRAHV